MECVLRSLTTAIVFSFGSGEKGQLGNGRTGEHITTGNKTGYDIEPSPSKNDYSSFVSHDASILRQLW
jgi:hypothetical protein